MSANAFRSHLMQQFVAAARTNHRPPPIGALRTTTSHHFHHKPQDKQTNMDINESIQKRNISSSPIRGGATHFSTPSYSGALNTSSQALPLHQDMHLEEGEDEILNLNAQSFQELLKTRRTTSNFVPLNELPLNHRSQIYDAIFRSIECAVQAPNHYRTEPTTYYRIMPNTTSWEKLLDITYNVALIKNKMIAGNTEEEAIIKAESKQLKWRETIAGYIVVCVSGQPDQQVESDTNNDYEIFPIRPPETERQMEDYASACASIQNILLALHSEGLGAKWATGPIPRCKAMRALVGCQADDLIAGLVLVGLPRSEVKQWRKRRQFMGNIFRDL